MKYTITIQVLNMVGATVDFKQIEVQSDKNYNHSRFHIREAALRFMRREQQRAHAGAKRIVGAEIAMSERILEPLETIYFERDYHYAR